MGDALGLVTMGLVAMGLVATRGRTSSKATGCVCNPSEPFELMEGAVEGKLASLLWAMTPAVKRKLALSTSRRGNSMLRLTGVSGLLFSFI